MSTGITRLTALVKNSLSLFFMVIISHKNLISYLGLSIAPFFAFLGLADEANSLQSFEVFIKTLQQNKLLGDDVDLSGLAAQIKAFSESEVEAVPFLRNFHWGGGQK